MMIFTSSIGRSSAPLDISSLQRCNVSLFVIEIDISNIFICMYTYVCMYEYTCMNKWINVYMCIHVYVYTIRKIHKYKTTKTSKKWAALRLANREILLHHKNCANNIHGHIFLDLEGYSVSLVWGRSRTLVGCIAST
jgi:hypothetical protein